MGSENNGTCTRHALSDSASQPRQMFKFVIVFNYSGDDVDIRLNFASIHKVSADFKSLFWALVSASEHARGAGGNLGKDGYGVRIHIVGKSCEEFIELISDAEDLQWYTNRTLDMKQVDAGCAIDSNSALVSKMQSFLKGLSSKRYAVPWSTPLH